MHRLKIANFCVFAYIKQLANWGCDNNQTFSVFSSEIAVGIDTATQFRRQQLCHHLCRTIVYASAGTLSQPRMTYSTRSR